jgi:predicted unusual protein kinase regulating ubiquinone biosynthesis (AarF/ABC1/UbiB family)
MIVILFAARSLVHAYASCPNNFEPVTLQCLYIAAICVAQSIAQLDLRVEAEALRRFTASFADDPHVAFPQPLPGMATELVLVETLLTGQVRQ